MLPRAKVKTEREWDQNKRGRGEYKKGRTIARIFDTEIHAAGFALIVKAKIAFKETSLPATRTATL